MLYVLKTPIDDYQSDIVFVDKDKFKSEIEIDYLFCVDSLESTRCFSSNKRYLCLTNKYRNKFNLEKGYGYKDIDKCLKGVELVTFKRKVDENGKKINDEFEMERGYYEGLDVFGLGYDSLNIIINIDGELKKYAPERVYIIS